MLCESLGCVNALAKNEHSGLYGNKMVMHGKFMELKNNCMKMFDVPIRTSSNNQQNILKMSGKFCPNWSLALRCFG
jgi:hypothetical protein